VLLERPWDRVKSPVTIPEPLNADQIGQMAAVDFAVLLRDHLVPREPAGGGRRQWERLWDLLAADDRLADRAFDVLDEFLDAAEAALESGELDSHQQSRARKFTRFCEDGWKRLQVDSDRPLGWAGRAAANFSPPARKVLQQLVDAIDTHRREVTAGGVPSAEDRQLWSALRAVDLDPEGARGRRRRE